MGTTSIGVGRGESGSRVDLIDQARSITPSPLGVTGLVGAYEWGPVNEAVIHSGKVNYVEVRGAALREDQTPLAAEHWYQAARGAGALITLRLVDGDESQAQLGLYARDAAATKAMTTPTAPPSKTVFLQGRYPGRRGGQKDAFAAHNTNLATAFSATAGTFTTGIAMLVDQWKDANLGFESFARTFKVTANSAAGVLTIEVPTGETGPTGAGSWFLTLAPTRFDGKAYGRAVQVDNSTQKPGTETKLRVYDRFVDTTSPVKTWQSVGFDTTKDSYIADVIQNEADANLQHHLLGTVDPVPDPSADEYRPANWAGVLALGSGVTNTVTLETTFWERISTVGAGTAFLDPDTVAYGTQPERVRAICTFTAATTCDVVYQTWDEAAISSGYTTAAGEGLTLGTLFDQSVPFLPAFTLQAGGVVMVTGDTITVYFSPLPLNLNTLNGTLYAHAHDQGAANNIRTSFPVRSNTATTVTLSSNVDLGADHTVVAPVAVSVTGTNSDPLGAIGGGETFIYNVGAEAATTLTESLGAGVQTASAVAADFNVQELAAHPIATGGPRINFTAPAGAVIVTTVEDFGSAAALTIGGGTYNGILGFAPGTTSNGVDGTVVALSYIDHLWQGRDGVASLGNDNEYLDAFDVSSSPLNTLLTQALGVVRYAIPGVSTAAAQNQAITWVAANGHLFRGEFPTNLTDEDSAAAWKTDNITGDENISMAWDSHGFAARKPFAGTETTHTMSGAIMGMEARLAAEKRGYHVAAAGIKTDFGDVFNRLLTDDNFTQEAPRKDTGILNSAGIQAVNHEGATVYVFGDRNSADSYDGTVWKHKVEARLHMLHTLARAGDSFVFEDLGLETRALLKSVIRSLMRDLYDKGWFARTSASTFENTVIIEVGDDVNTPAAQAIGELRALVTIPGGIVGTAERVVFALGTGGVAVVEEQ